MDVYTTSVPGRQCRLRRFRVLCAVSAEGPLPQPAGSARVWGHPGRSPRRSSDGGRVIRARHRRRDTSGKTSEHRTDGPARAGLPPSCLASALSRHRSRVRRGPPSRIPSSPCGPRPGSHRRYGQAAPRRPPDRTDPRRGRWNRVRRVSRPPRSPRRSPRCSAPALMPPAPEDGGVRPEVTRAADARGRRAPHAPRARPRTPGVGAGPSGHGAPCAPRTDPRRRR